MTFVNNQQRVAGQVIEQTWRRLAGLAPGQVARVILDARAVAHLEDHLHIELRALLESLRFYEPVGLAEPLQADAELSANLVDCRNQRLTGGDVVGLRVNRGARRSTRHLARQRIEIGDLLDLVVE